MPLNRVHDGICVPPETAHFTGYRFTTGFNNLWPTRGGNGEHEVINYFELTCSGSPDGKPLHPFVDPSGHHEPLSYD